MSGLQAIVLDFDGVIADSEPLHYEAFRLTLAEDDIALGRDEYYAQYLGYDDIGLALALARDRRLPVDPSWAPGLVERKGRALQRLLADGAALFPGVEAFVREAAARVPVAIASGALRHEIEQVVGAAGLGDLFTAIVGSGDTPESKPSPAPYQLAFERLRALSGRDLDPERTVAVEDSRWGIESARGAGLRCVGVTTSYPAAELAGAELVAPGLGGLSLDELDRLCASPRT